MLHVQISEKLEDKKTPGTNRLSKDLSSEYNDLWIGQGQVLRLFVRETYISSFPFLEKWIWPSTNHWECVLFMLCQKLQHASLSLLVALPLFVIMLCVVWRKPQCVLFVMGARGWGRCFQLPLGRMTDGKTIKHRTWAQCVCARAHVCVCVCSSTRNSYIWMCASLPVHASLCTFMCAWRHVCFHEICTLIFLIFFHSTFLGQQGNCHHC